MIQSGSPYCDRCGKPFTYVGDVPTGGFPAGQAPWCECNKLNPTQGLTCPSLFWRYCPHCGKELK